MIAICTNPYRDADFSCTRECVDRLGKTGFSTCVCPVFTDSDWNAPLDLNICSLTDILSDLTHIIVIGGDGTILAVVRQLQGCRIPIIGINMGTKGFMTTLEADELSLLIDTIQNPALVTERMMLDLSLIRGGKTILHETALNDVVVHGYGECIKPTAWANGKMMFCFSGDGLIIATPTGSTGYSLSAGGPIVEPEAKAILLTPICAHTLAVKPFVLSPRKKVRVLTEKLTGRRAYLAVDGYQLADLESGDLLEITSSEKCVLMIEQQNRSFYEQLEKLI